MYVPDAAEAAVAKLARSLAASDPSAATALAVDLPPSTARTRALAYSLKRWATEDLNAMSAWAEHSEDPAVVGLAGLLAGEAGLTSDPPGAGVPVSADETGSSRGGMESPGMSSR